MSSLWSGVASFRNSTWTYHPSHHKQGTYKVFLWVEYLTRSYQDRNLTRPPSTQQSTSVANIASDSSRSKQCAKHSNSIPTTCALFGQFIPTLPSGPGAWKAVIKQWDPTTGMIWLLKDWLISWYTGSQKRLFGTTYSQCRNLATAYKQ